MPDAEQHKDDEGGMAVNEGMQGSCDAEAGKKKGRRIIAIRRPYEVFTLIITYVKYLQRYIKFYPPQLLTLFNYIVGGFLVYC